MLNESNVKVADGVTLAMLHPDLNSKFSPNLHAFLRKYRMMQFRLGLAHDGIKWLIAERDGFVSGAKLMAVLCNGAKTQVWDISGSWRGNVVDGFWLEYARIGRCAIDLEHTEWFVDDDKRWHLSADGNERLCLWCGQARQRKEVYHVPHERWVSA